MDSIVGFTLLFELPPERVEAALAAQRQVVGRFPRLRSASLSIGDSRLEIWGHGDLAARVTRLGNGSTLALVGSPHGRASLADLPEDPARVGPEGDFQLPWDGRVVLLEISADGRRWTMWNDWMGSLPVFHVPISRGRVASTLEPVTVAAAGFSRADLFLPAVLSILINGHCLADWTLYQRMKVVPADAVAEWDESGFRSRPMRSVEPSQDRWETPWNDLVDEMHDLSRRAVLDTIGTTRSWVLPLSGGLDSRLIAAVLAGLGLDVRARVWGSHDTTDVVHSRHVANALGIPWADVDLGTDYLVRHTERWAAWFGGELHFHGMYQMAFLEGIDGLSPGPLISGFAGDVLAGAGGLRVDPRRGHLYDEWYTHWTVEEVRALMKVPIDAALAQLSAELERERTSMPGAAFQGSALIELWSRCRLFTSFHATLADYWRGVATPFLSRAYARFCLSLPATALGDERRLLADVFRRHYGLLATIPGTYAEDPFVLTGRYLLKRRIADALPMSLRVGPLTGFRRVQPRMDVECVQAHGWKALWPIEEARSRLAEWLDVSMLDLAYNAVMSSTEDMRPLRKLQSVQALAHRLLDA